jgi:lipoic acid synthetase
MGLKYAVITSVDRDDLEDAGSTIFEMTIKAVHKSSPGCKVEVLIPDFGGVRESLQRVVDARPEVLNHNIETVRRVFRKVRPAGDYDLSLELLKRAKEMNPDGVTKSGMMVGLGETMDEVLQTMEDLRTNNTDLLTIGQYLRPSKKHHPIIRFYHPDEFEKIREAGEAMGFSHVASGPLVRSSYHADEQHEASLGNPAS